MPSFDFSVYCTCGTHLDSSLSKDTLTVEPCESCLGELRDQIKELNDRISDLESRNDRLEDELRIAREND
jgi:predicted RNase H-like nuclease (RuvC/YqgF family)